ncbi:MAG TPA: RDD family protein [Acidimicrobiales bacterium]|jgi:hypothetical protein
MTDQQRFEGSLAPRAATAGLDTPTAPDGRPLSSPGRRLIASLLDVLLGVVTLGIGWFIWSLVVWGRGVTPAKSLMKMETVRADSGANLTWGGMFVREFLVKGIVASLLSIVTFGIMGIVGPLLILAGTLRQTLWDRIAKTLVVDAA